MKKYIIAAIVALFASSTAVAEGLSRDFIRFASEIDLRASGDETSRFNLRLRPATSFPSLFNASGRRAASIHLGQGAKLPPMFSAQFFFLDPKFRFQPYVGLGLNYTFFFDERSSRESGPSNRLEDSWGLAAQVGADFAITDQLFMNASVWKMDMGKPYSDFGKIKADASTDPWVYFLGVGFKF